MNIDHSLVLTYHVPMQEVSHVPEAIQVSQNTREQKDSALPAKSGKERLLALLAKMKLLKRTAKQPQESQPEVQQPQNSETEPTRAIPRTIIRIGLAETEPYRQVAKPKKSLDETYGIHKLQTPLLKEES